MWEIFMWFSGFKGKTPFYRIFLQREAFDFRHIEVDYFIFFLSIMLNTTYHVNTLLIGWFKCQVRIYWLNFYVRMVILHISQSSRSQMFY